MQTITLKEVTSQFGFWQRIIPCLRSGASGREIQKILRRRGKEESLRLEIESAWEKTGVPREKYQKFRELIRDNWGWANDLFHPDDEYDLLFDLRFNSDQFSDDLAFVEFVMDLEDAFGIQMSEDSFWDSRIAEPLPQLHEFLDQALRCPRLPTDRKPPSSTCAGCLGAGLLTIVSAFIGLIVGDSAARTEFSDFPPGFQEPEVRFGSWLLSAVFLVLTLGGGYFLSYRMKYWRKPIWIKQGIDLILTSVVGFGLGASGGLLRVAAASSVFPDPIIQFALFGLAITAVCILLVSENTRVYVPALQKEKSDDFEGEEGAEGPGASMPCDYSNRTTIPTRQEISPTDGQDMDERQALKHFQGKSDAQMRELFQTQPELVFPYCDDFAYMGKRAFAYYFPVLAEFMITSSSAGCEELASLLYVLEARLEYDRESVFAVKAEVVQTLEHVLNDFTHFADDTHSYPDPREQIRAFLAKIKETP